MSQLKNLNFLCGMMLFSCSSGGGKMENKFKVVSKYKPTGDQPQAIEKIAEGFQKGLKFQTLLGVTGSGKTFTMANIIEKIQKPTLVIAHNKTLAAQLYNELKEFFPENAVEYFVSYYDYYQPEAYVPSTDTYIEKDSSVNDEIDKLRHSATAALVEREDVIVVASVSCIYGLGDPEEYYGMMLSLRPGMEKDRDEVLRALVEMQYDRNDLNFERGTFRVRGDVVEIFPIGSSEHAIRVEFFGDEIDRITEIDVLTGEIIGTRNHISIFPASHYVTAPEKMQLAIQRIEKELEERLAELKREDKLLEAQRLEQRTNYDLEMLREMGFCTGIENYSRYFDGRMPGTRPLCLLDYFPKDFMVIIDESHVTIPQIRAMYGGDNSRKVNLVEYGFRLPAAIDNRPLTFAEFESLVPQVIYVSATPADYELARSEGVVVEQVIRPTGLLDPVIEVRPSLNQIDDLLEEIQQRVERNERVLVTTLTKRMAEELNAYLLRLDIHCNYIHSDVDTLDRIQIIDDLRKGVYDVLVGVNLLREGLDLPEVSLVAILDADKEGFLRSHRSLTQTAGRAARNLNGRVIMYADRITDSMQQTIDETNRRREKQLAYNEAHHITPQAIRKAYNTALARREDKTVESIETPGKPMYEEEFDTVHVSLAADPIVPYMSKEQLKKNMENVRRQMVAAAKNMEFIEAARLRDELLKLEDLYNHK